ncbi:hypothetical protein LTR37_012468 [Vermiconidia calcicola]|uniref:Uncharacterized protein n=1 Tax=Vermiconidia calcicola TaxID=1690605 RepID=A0ACC3N003_9PEZI|nr:hypothetical protein LTR37_012468 [Vermiconidia calcicola]
MRELTAPRLFKEVKVKHGWWGGNCSLKALEKSTHVFTLTRTFEMEMYVDDGGKRSRPPKRLCARLATVLPALPKLTRLTLNLPEYQTEPFRKEFQNRAVTLPTAIFGGKERRYSWLDANVDGEYKNRHCFDLIRAAGEARRLRHFELQARWERSFLSAIRKAMPKIQSLALPGTRYEDGIGELLPLFDGFSELKVLGLSNAADLDVGYNPPGCGNVYMGPGGDAVRKSVQEQGRRAEQRVARMVFRRLNGLEELWVGNYDRAKAVRTASRDITEITWDRAYRYASVIGTDRN